MVVEEMYQDENGNVYTETEWVQYIPGKIDELKSNGNKEFIKQQYEHSEKLYTKALELQCGGKFCKDTMHILLCNRAAARIHLQNYDDALIDSQKAIELKPEWAKAHYRYGQALEALNEYRKSQKAFEKSIKYGDKSNSTKAKIEKMRKKADQIERSMDISSRESMKYVYANLSDTRERLGFLVFFWNASSQMERYSTFLRLLQILSGFDQPLNISHWKKEDMKHLPTANYEHLKLPASWLKYYNSLNLNEKVTMFEDFYKMLDTTEQTVVVNDMKFFLQEKESLDNDDDE